MDSDQYRQLYRYFTDYIFKKESQLNLLANKEASLAQLEDIRSKVIPGAKELQLLGRFLGINQGMKTNDFQEYSWIKNLESEINRIYSDAGKSEELLRRINRLKYAKKNFFAIVYFSFDFFCGLFKLYCEQFI